jgi:hypothetical protein
VSNCRTLMSTALGECPVTPLFLPSPADRVAGQAAGSGRASDFGGARTAPPDVTMLRTRTVGRPRDLRLTTFGTIEQRGGS